MKGFEERDRQTDRQRDKETERQTQTQTRTETERDRERVRERQREGGRERENQHNQHNQHLGSIKKSRSKGMKNKVSFCHRWQMKDIVTCLEQLPYLIPSLLLT